MIQPVLRDEALLADIHEAADAEDVFHLWWLGQSGYLLKWNGKHLLIDPYLSDSLTRKYEGTDKPHVRMTARAIAPERLDFIDVVTSSHNHTDHLDAETLLPLLGANPGLTLVVPEANRQFAADRLGLPPHRLTGIDAGKSVQAKGFELTGVPAAHEQIERDDEGRHRFLGYVVSFGRWHLYHSGDTVRYDGMAERLREWPLDVAILPINGSKPQRRVAGNLDGREAARLAHDIGARVAIPCHYEMFEFNTAGPEPFIGQAEQLGQSVAVLKCGERFSNNAIER